MALYTIDLDQPPEQRWIPLLKDFKSSAPLIRDYFNQEVNSKMSFVSTKRVSTEVLLFYKALLFTQAPKVVGDLLKVIMADLDGYLGELGQEMRAIADYMELDLGTVVTLNFAYELRRVSNRSETVYIVYPVNLRAFFFFLAWRRPPKYHW